MDTQRFAFGEHEWKLEPLSWQQNKWLADHVFQDIDLSRLDYATIWDLFREKGPLIMAISLVDVGMTRTEHSRCAFETISRRAAEFAAELTGAEVAKFAPYFFQSCRPDQLAMLMPGKVLQQMAVAAQAEEASPSPAAGEATSSAVSSPSAAAMSPSSAPSSPNGGQPSPSPISVDALSGSTSIMPSSVSVG